VLCAISTLNKHRAIPSLAFTRSCGLTPPAVLCLVCTALLTNGIRLLPGRFHATGTLQSPGTASQRGRGLHHQSNHVSSYLAVQAVQLRHLLHTLQNLWNAVHGIEHHHCWRTGGLPQPAAPIKSQPCHHLQRRPAHSPIVPVKHPSPLDTTVLQCSSNWAKRPPAILHPNCAPHYCCLLGRLPKNAV